MYSELSDAFGERVRLERELRGWSQAELAERAGTNRSHIGQIESEDRVYGLTLRTMTRLASALGYELRILWHRNGKGL